MTVFAVSLPDDATALNALSRVTAAFDSDVLLVRALGGKIIKAHTLEGRVYVLGIYDPLYFRPRIIVPFMLIASIATIVIWGAWWTLPPVLIVAAFEFFYSSTYFYVLFRLLLRKGGYKGSVQRHVAGHVVKEYLAWVKRMS